MIEPPPRQLETSASMPLKLQMSKRPCRPLLGSQKLRAISRGCRGNVPGAHALPRSSRSTRRPPCCRRYALTDPPKPEPTTTASTCSDVLTGAPSSSLRGARGREPELSFGEPRPVGWSTAEPPAREDLRLGALGQGRRGSLLVHPVREGHARLGPPRRQPSDVRAQRGVGDEVAVVLEHRALALGEDVEVDADRRDRAAYEAVGVRRHGRLLGIAVGRTRDAPVGPLELPGGEVRAQPPLADVGRLLEQDDREAQAVPDTAEAGVRPERRAGVRYEDGGVVTPDRLDAEVVVHPAV